MFAADNESLEALIRSAAFEPVLSNTLRARILDHALTNQRFLRGFRALVLCMLLIATTATTGWSVACVNSWMSRVWLTTGPIAGDGAVAGDYADGLTFVDRQIDRLQNRAARFRGAL